MKQKNTLTNPDLIRAIKLLNAKIAYVDNAVVSVSGMFREFVTFMEFEDQFLDYLEAKTEEDEGKD